MNLPCHEPLAGPGFSLQQDGGVGVVGGQHDQFLERGRERCSDRLIGPRVGAKHLHLLPEPSALGRAGHGRLEGLEVHRLLQ